MRPTSNASAQMRVAISLPSMVLVVHFSNGNNTGQPCGKV